MKSRSHVSDREIEAGLAIAARLVDRYGEKYWPAFQRLEEELEARRSRAARVAAYLPKGGSEG